MNKCCRALLIAASVGAVYLIGDRCCNNQTYQPSQEYPEPIITHPASVPAIQPTTRASEGKLAPDTDEAMEIHRESIEREKGGK